MIEADSLESIQGRSVLDIVTPEHRAAFAETTRAVFLGESRTLEFEILGLKGTRRWLETHAVPLRDSHGAIVALLGITRDITERRSTDEALQRSLLLLSTLTEGTSDAIFMKDLKGRYVIVNSAEARLIGRDRDAILGRTDLELFPPEVAAPICEMDLHVMASGESRTYEEEWPVEGVPQTLLSVKGVYRDGEDRIAGVFGIGRNITDRKRAETLLRDSEERYRLLFENNPHPMWVYRTDTLAFLAINHAASVVYGYTKDEFLGLTLRDIRPPEDFARLQQSVAAAPDGPEVSSGWRHRRKDGTDFEVEVHSHSIQFDGIPSRLVLVQDVSEQRKLEDRYRQSQKMEAIGHLAGGVAHDFNNLLTAILGNADMLKEEIPRDDPRREYVEEIGQVARKAAGLTRQLLALGRKQVLDPQRLDLNGVVTALASLLQRTLPENITLDTCLAPHLGAVIADRTQIEQVVLNLIVNARDAMAVGGTLTLETHDFQQFNDGAQPEPQLKPGRYSVLSVSDTGCGMSPEVRRRIFEPFFTTKPVGQGTGLGLATVYGIVQQSEGHITVYSEVGRGTTFRVYLPLASDPKATTTLPTEDSLPPGVGARATILLAEDDASVRRIAQEALERDGHRVLTAGDGENALRVAEEHPGMIDLAVMDLVMPGMSSDELTEQLLLLQPDCRLLYISGYSEAAVTRHGRLRPGSGFLPKPFTRAALVREVREALARVVAGR